MTNTPSELRFELPSDFTDCGSLNFPTLARLRVALDSATKAITSPVLALDLSNVHVAGAEFISILLAARYDLRRSGQQLNLRRVNRYVAEIFAVCRLTELFGIEQ